VHEAELERMERIEARIVRIVKTMTRPSSSTSSP